MPVLTKFKKNRQLGIFSLFLADISFVGFPSATPAVGELSILDFSWVFSSLKRWFSRAHRFANLVSDLKAFTFHQKYF